MRGKAADAGASDTDAGLTTSMERHADGFHHSAARRSAGQYSSSVNDLEIEQLDIAPDYALNAVRVEVIDPRGNGVRMWLDAPLGLNVALRIVAAYTRLRGLGTVP